MHQELSSALAGVADLAIDPLIARLLPALKRASDLASDIKFLRADDRQNHEMAILIRNIENNLSLSSIENLCSRFDVLCQKLADQRNEALLKDNQNKLRDRLLVEDKARRDAIFNKVKNSL